MFRPLVYLNVRNTPIPDVLLRFIVTRTPYLTELFCESCTLLTDYSIMKLSNSCPNLKVLDLSFCELVTDVSLQIFTIQAASSINGSNLEEIYLSACDLVTPLAIHQLVQKCPRLQLLVLDGCEKILGSYVGEFATFKDDGITCTFETKDIKKLATYIHFNSDKSDHLQNKFNNMQLNPPHETKHVLIKRDSNRSLRARQSTHNIGLEDVQDFANAVLLERQQKIREKWDDNKQILEEPRLMIPNQAHRNMTRHSMSTLYDAKKELPKLRHAYASMAPIREQEKTPNLPEKSVKSNFNPNSREFTPSNFQDDYNTVESYHNSESMYYDPNGMPLIDLSLTYSPPGLVPQETRYEDWQYAQYYQGNVDPQVASQSELLNKQYSQPVYSNLTNSNVSAKENVSVSEPVASSYQTNQPEQVQNIFPDSQLLRSPSPLSKRMAEMKSFDSFKPSVGQAFESQVTDTQSSQWGAEPEIWNNPAIVKSNSSTFSNRSIQSTIFVDPWKSKVRPESCSAAERTLRKSQSQLLTQTKSSFSNIANNASASRLSVCSGWKRPSNINNVALEIETVYRGAFLLKLAIETKKGTHEFLTIHQVILFLIHRMIIQKIWQYNFVNLMI
jgi:hypothetical protein